MAKVMKATTSYPAEALAPGYESMSHYKVNFSAQERVLHAIDFIKVKEEAPEEQEPRPEETQPEVSVWNLEQPVPEPALEPFREPLPVSVCPPVPTQMAVPVAPQVPAPFQESNTEDGLVKAKAELEEMRGEAEGCVATDPVKEGSLCEDQDGMTTQQVGIKTRSPTQTGSPFSTSSESPCRLSFSWLKKK